MTLPNPNDHLIQARANRDHAEWLLATRPNDPTARQWAVTATFYSALHGLTAHLGSRGVQVSDHRSRAQALVDPANGVPHSIIRTYRILEGRSRGARYQLWQYTPQQVRSLIDQQLAASATFVGM
jgi:hypothetical protein